MGPMERYEEAAISVADLSKKQLTSRIKHFKGSFRLDFSDEYLRKLSVDKLRHVLLAAIINARPQS